MTPPRCRAFVISLRRARERRLHVLKSVENMNISYEIVDAFDARQVRSEFLIRGNGGENLKDGEVACYHSHIGLFERIVDYGLDYGLILEDDFIVGDSMGLTLRNVWDHLPPDADHIQLHNFKSHFSSCYQVEEKGEHFNKLECTNVMTVGYIISNRLAKFMLRCHPIPKMPIDCQLIEISKQRIFDFYDVNEAVISANWRIPSQIHG